MFNIGPLELIVVLIIALIVLGPQRLPEVARSVGRGMREFRNALDREHDDEEDEVADEEEDGDEPDRRLEQGERRPAAAEPEGDERPELEHREEPHLEAPAPRPADPKQRQ